MMLNISTDKIMISDRAHVILPYHLEIDEIQETRRGANNIGTTKKGIGPTYVDKYERVGIRMGEFIDEELFKERLEEALASKKAQYPELTCSAEEKSLKNIKNMLKSLHQWFVILVLF